MADISKELPPIDKHDHPENRLMMWSELELRAIEQYRQAAYKLGRDAGLEEAQKLDWVEVMRKGSLVTWGDAGTLGYRVVEKLESLKDNTP